MKKIASISILFSIFVFATAPADEFPQAVINNGLIKAKLYLPDSKKGYYRGSRFDWSAVMPELEFMGHTYFGQWFDKYNPTHHDAIMGPVEEFLPVGYEEAKTGEQFLKIGIGMVTKPDEKQYFFVTPYPLVNGGVWKVKKKADRIEFQHTLQDKKYAYEYKKTVRLPKGKPEMELWHSLKNTGKEVIETSVYNHNFFVIDKETIGKDFEVIFPFRLSGEAQGKGNFGKLENNQIVFLKNLAKNENFYFQNLTGFGGSSKDYDIRIENHKTGAAVRIRCDQSISRLVFWSAYKTLCPEPYIQIKVKPGETFNWKISYEFYLCDIKDKQ